MKHVEKWKKQILWLVLSSLLLFSGCGSTQSADRSDAEVTASAGAVTQNQEEATSSDESNAKADVETDLELQSQSQSDAANASYILSEAPEYSGSPYPKKATCAFGKRHSPLPVALKVPHTLEACSSIIALVLGRTSSSN